MLATSKNVLFPDHNHLLTTGTDDPTDYRLSTRWLLPGNRTFLDGAGMVVTWWIVAFLSRR